MEGVDKRSGMLLLYKIKRVKWTHTIKKKEQDINKTNKNIIAKVKETKKKQTKTKQRKTKTKTKQQQNNSPNLGNICCCCLSYVFFIVRDS